MISKKLPNNPPQAPIQNFYHDSTLHGNIKLAPPKEIENAKPWKNQQTGGRQSPMKPAGVEKLKEAMSAQFLFGSKGIVADFETQSRIQVGVLPLLRRVPLLLLQVPLLLLLVPLLLLQVPLLLLHRVPKGNRNKDKAFPNGGSGRHNQTRMQVAQDCLSQSAPQLQAPLHKSRIPQRQRVEIHRSSLPSNDPSHHSGLARKPRRRRLVDLLIHDQLIRVHDQLIRVSDQLIGVSDPLIGLRDLLVGIPRGLNHPPTSVLGVQADRRIKKENNACGVRGSLSGDGLVVRTTMYKLV